MTLSRPPQRYRELVAGEPAEHVGFGLVASAWRAATGGPLPSELWSDLRLPVEVEDGPAPALSPEELAEVAAGLYGGKPAGVYFTPAPVVEHLLDLLDLPDGQPTCLDPACGAGAFLIAAARRGVDVSRLHGRDNHWLPVLACRVLMVLLAGASLDTARANIQMADMLYDRDLPADLDVVLGNPPWGLRLGRDERLRLRDRWGDSPALAAGETCSAAVFLTLAAELVKPGGRVAMVQPETWLSSRRAEPLRRWLGSAGGLEAVSVLRKGVFAQAPDIVPTIALVRPGGRPPARVTIRRHGLRQPLADDGPLTWAAVARLPTKDWLAEPLAVLPAGFDERLAPLWRRMAAFPSRLGQVAAIHDGYYKTRLMPLLGEGGPEVLTTAAEVARYRLKPSGRRLAAGGLAALPAAERRRQTTPKLLLHALRKPALPDRLVAAADPEGRFVASNNLVLVIPRPPWDLGALACLLNSRLLNRWYADRFIQVNIEAFALGAIPLPAAPSPRLSELGRAPLGREPEVDDEVCRLYGVADDLREVIDERWSEGGGGR